jgi:putative transposon-encoded protein
VPCKEILTPFTTLGGYSSKTRITPFGGNSKFEYRNPKQISARETRKKHENKKAKRAIIQHSSFIIQHSISGSSIKTRITPFGENSKFEIKISKSPVWLKLLDYCILKLTNFKVEFII